MLLLHGTTFESRQIKIDNITCSLDPRSISANGFERSNNITILDRCSACRLNPLGGAQGAVWARNGPNHAVCLAVWARNGFCGGRRAVCLALYLHVYTYVYHTCIFTYINIRISHMCIYIHTHMYITHQRHPRHAYESPSRVPRRSCALSSATLLFQDAGVYIDTHRKTCIGSRSFGKAFGG